MDSDSWRSNRFSTSSRQRNYTSRSDIYLGGEEMENGDEEMRTIEYVCPFCAEDFDVVGLCCHVDEEHSVEAKSGCLNSGVFSSEACEWNYVRVLKGVDKTCPVCAKRIGMDMVGHLTSQHGSLLKVQRKRRFRKGGSNSTFSILRKELRDGNVQSFFGGSSFKIPFNSEPDPLLSSFISNLPQVDKSQLKCSDAETGKQIEEDGSLASVRSVEQSPQSIKDQKEASLKCEFVQGLLLSTIFNDDI